MDNIQIEKQVEMFRARLVDQSNRNTEIRRLRAEGMSLVDIGKQYGLTKQRVMQICHTRKPSEAIVLENTDRTDEMVKMRSAGSTLEEIAKVFGVSKQRVHQIIGNTSSKNLNKGNVSAASGTAKIAHEWELFVAEQIRDRGHNAKLMPYNSPYDILVDENIRVNVKSRSNPIAGTHGYKFRVIHHKDVTDFFAFVIIPERAIFIIPSSDIVGNNVTITYPFIYDVHRKIEYKDAYALLWTPLKAQP